MNRPIKFRGKRTDNGKWVYGYYVKAAGDSYVIPTLYHEIARDFDSYKVLPETVGEFTGLLDKNGKEIYEGDIVDGNWVVRWWDDEAEFVLCNPMNEQNINICAKEKFTKLSLGDAEVIGNVHSNPELLGEQK